MIMTSFATCEAGFFLSFLGIGRVENRNNERKNNFYSVIMI